VPLAALLVLLPATLAAEPEHLTVDAALARLDAANPSLARASAQVTEARAASLQALSGILPTVTGTGSYVRNNAEVTLDLSPLFDALSQMTGQPVEGADGPIVLQPLDAVSGTATVRVPLIAPSAWVGIGAARHAVAAAGATEQALQESLRGTALQAFWAEAAAEGFVGAREASAERARTLATSAARAADIGTATRLGLLQAQTEVARREGDVLQARAALLKARIAVGALLGTDGPVVVELPPPPEAPAAGAPGLDADALVAGAYTHRAEVSAAEEQGAAARGQLTAAKLGVLPTVSGGFSAFASTVAYSTGDKTGWRASLDLTWPLVQGGLRQATVNRAGGVLAESEAALEATRLQVAQQVRTAVADLDVAVERRDLATRQRALAEEAARVAQRSFDEGVLDSAGVLDALDRLDLARVSELDATTRVGIADAALRAATGRW
jgi:outer membrane protein TolC